MQRGSIINFNNVGRVSCLLLLAIVGLAVSPVASVATYAEEVDSASGAASAGSTVDLSSTAGTSNSTAGSTDSSDDYPISPTALTPSTIGIKFTPTNANASVTPVDTNAIPLYADVVATVTIASSGGYKVYLGSTNNDNYLRSDNEAYIEPIPDSSSYDLNSIPKNTWGYTAKANSKTVDHTNYKALPLTQREAMIDEGGVTKAEKTIDYALSFAAQVDTNIPAGTYAGSVTMSVVSSPAQITLADISTMQEMTSAICEESAISTATNATTSTNQVQLRDTRDGKYYWVGKMPDNRCWMTQNLDLDLFASDGEKADGQQHKKTVLTSKDSNVTADWSPSSDTIVTATTAPTDDNGQYSWSMSGYLGDTDYYTANPDSVASCGSKVENITKCGANDVGKWTLSSVPKSANNDPNAHRLLGNLYSWGAATAGATTTSVSTANQNAPQSICPLGWKLPTGNEGGEFQQLSNKLGVTEGTATTGTVKNFTDAPFYAVRGGVLGDTNDLFYLAGLYGRYWSSTANSDTNAYYLNFWSTVNILPSHSNRRRYGVSVRCINDPTK